MKILIIDDDNGITSFLKRALQEQCFEVDIANTGTDGLFYAKTNQYDLIVCDFLLPGKNGDQICTELRAENINLPILMLSVQGEPSQKASLLNCGADDYLTKPFSLEELVARVKALLRRPKKMELSRLVCGDLEIDSDEHSVKRASKEIHLPLKEFMLLEYLAKNAGRVVTRSEIIEHVWDMNADLFSNTIEAHVSNIRKKIDIPGKSNLIHTISGRGYKMDVGA